MDIKTLDGYQQAARSFATGGGETLEYAVLGLAEEAGEVAGKVAKFIRKHPGASVDTIGGDIETRAAISLELGDCLWMVANAAAALGLTLATVANMNITKLEGRKKRGTIIGEGDHR